MDCFLFFKGQCHMCKVLERKFYWLKNEMDEQFYMLKNEVHEQKEVVYQQGQKIRTLEKVCFRFSTYYTFYMYNI